MIRKHVPFWCFFFVLSSLACNSSLWAMSLGSFSFNAAGVIPVVRDSQTGKHYVLLGRESHGPDKGLYDCFFGKRDAWETHSVVTAAREFAEESKDLFMSRKHVKNYIDVRNKHTVAVLANKSKKVVHYLTYFDYTRLNNVIRRFCTAAGQQEKDKLALVPWGALKKAIARAKPGASVKISTRVISRRGIAREAIIIRPILVAALRPYCKNIPAQVGNHKKILYYR